VPAGVSNRITPMATSPNRTRLLSVVVDLLLQFVVLEILRRPVKLPIKGVPMACTPRSPVRARERLAANP
jgi:hypothetical protein